jgi:CBS domain-containing protein
MKTINYLLKTKGERLCSITPDASVFDAIELMIEKGVDALAVIEAEKLVGIISDYDLAKKSILAGKRITKETKVKDIMTDHVFYVHPEQTVEKCLALMTEKHIRHLPVISGNRLVSIVSMEDLARTIITDQKVLIQQLENYILETCSIT